MMFEASKLVPKIGKRCCVFNDKLSMQSVIMLELLHIWRENFLQLVKVGASLYNV